MDKKQVSESEKIEYVKPVILDLGEVTAAYGAASCQPTGDKASGSCNNGDYAGGCQLNGFLPGSTSY